MKQPKYEITEKTSRSTVVTERVVKKFAIAKGLYAFHVTETSLTTKGRVTGRLIEPVVRVYEFIGKSVDKASLDHRVVTEADLKGINGGGGYDQLFESNVAFPYSQLLAGGIPIREYWNSYQMIFDLKGVPYPVGIRHDYLQARMHNQCYDLPKAIKILGRRKDIQELTREVQDIPYYNQEEGLRNYISFVWAPKRSDYVKLWDYCKKKFRQYPSTHFHEAIFALDLLGLRAGGAAYGRTFYESKD